MPPTLQVRSTPIVHSAVRCAVALVGSILLGCDETPRNESRTAPRIFTPTTATPIFSPSAVAKAESDSAVAAVLRSAVPPDTALSYRIFRWDFSNDTRFLILAYVTRVVDGHYGPALYAVEAGRVSTPYDFKDEENVVIGKIADFDHDASPDVAICARFGAQEEVVVARVVGYRDGTWYRIPAATHAIACNPAALSGTP
jgi:hypothetical protein